MADFHLAIPTVLAHEGGYCNDPNDAGGETKFGISKRSYPKVDIRNLTLEEAKHIYQRDFWKQLKLDAVTDQAVATKLLDSAVLIGCKRAVTFLQRAVQSAGGGLVEVDGKMGPATIAAVNRCSPLLLLPAFRQLLITYYEGLVQDLPTNGRFLRGWIKRANA